MIVTQSFQSHATILRFVGRFEFAARKEIHTAFTNALKECAGHVILNLHGVSYIDSAGLGMLGNFDDKLRGRQIEASLVNLQPTVKKIITMARLEEKFSIFSTEEEALSRQHPSPIGK